MISTTTRQFLENPNLLHRLQEDNTFVSLDSRGDQVGSWNVIQLNFFQVVLRKLFGVFGLYQNTHSSQVIDALKRELKPLLSFHDDIYDVRKVIRIAQKVLHLQNVEEPSRSVSDAVADSVNLEAGRVPFKKTLAFVEGNRAQIDDLKKEGTNFTLKGNGSERLKILIAATGVKILGNRLLGSGGFKKVKTAFDTETKTPLARAVMSIGNAQDNLITRLFDKIFHRGRIAKNELYFLEMVKGDPTCIQLDSSYSYVGKTGTNKLAMLMELADGDLADLIFQQNLTIDHRLEIASQLIDGISALSKREIWHRDIKPLNFLYSLTQDGHYKVRVADFGLAAPNRDILAEKFVGGTYGYVAPENFKFFRLQNGKEGDIYSLGRTFEDLFPVSTRPVFIDQLIIDMLQRTPSNRPSAESLQSMFREQLMVHKPELASFLFQ